MLFYWRVKALTGSAFCLKSSTLYIKNISHLWRIAQERWSVFWTINRLYIIQIYFASLVNSTGEIKSLLNYQPALYIQHISHLWWIVQERWRVFWTINRLYIKKKYFASLVNSTWEMKSLLNYQPALYINNISHLWWIAQERWRVFWTINWLCI